MWWKKKLKAPWEGSTPQEDADYETALSLGGAEFEMEIADRMGPYGRRALDWTLSDMIVPMGYPGGKPGKKRDWTLKGFYTPDDWYMDPEYYGYIEHITGEKLTGDKVYTINPENTNPFIQAHEYRHRFVEKKRRNEGRKTEFMKDVGADESDKGLERRNRLWDAYLAQGKDEWKDQVYWWKDLHKQRTGETIKYDEAERDLKRNLLKHYKDMAHQEALSYWEDYQGVPYKVDTDKYEKDFAKRASKWDD